MRFKLACGDVLPGCPARFEAPSQPHLLQQVATHARDEHGITAITPDVERSIIERITVSA